MEFEDIKTKINTALDRLYENEFELIETDVAEETINSYLANYIRPLFDDFNTDVEYNREYVFSITPTGLKYEKPQTKKTIKPNGELDSINPDIIIHKRNNTVSNLVVVECKKQWNKDKEGREKDLQVLGGMTMNREQANQINYPKNEPLFEYKYGFFVDYGKNREEVLVYKIKNGTTELQRI